MLTVDLHVHSNRSDGSLSPTQLVDYAIEKGLAAFALTDHDSIDGLEEAIRYAQELREKQNRTAIAPAKTAQSEASQNTECKAQVSERKALAPERKAQVPERMAQASERRIQTPEHKVPEVIPGIEFSTEYMGQDVHVVGLYIDYRDEDFTGHLKAFVDSRVTRNRKMCSLLQENGIPVSYEELTAEFPDAVITRAHYAKYMLSHGYVKTMSEAFDRYIGDDCPCYIPREKVTPVQAVELILSAGGIPILAHPVLYHMSDAQLDALTALLKEAGLIGLEAVYSTYTASDERRMRALAKKYGLAVSGGSDFHGANKPGLDLAVGYGNLFVPYSVLEGLRAAWQRHAT